jgi:hypothetical protein
MPSIERYTSQELIEMKPSIKCKLVYNKSPHLQQLYAGFLRLQALGIVDLLFDTEAPDSRLSRLPILHVTVNERFRVVYDELDGFNWIPGTIEENLTFFQTAFKVDYYFKRSFNRQVVDMAPLGCKVLPLGLNYHVRPEHVLGRMSIRDNLQAMVRRNDFASRILRLKNEEIALPAEDYEYFPLPRKDIRILCLTRVWNPDDFDSERTKADIETINNSRISAIKSCQKEFGKIFCGGLSDNEFARNHAKSLIASLSLTNKRSYLELVKLHAICIATTGLHGSIGWKFSEYVAASRAILCEPLIYEAPGGFKKEQNYLEFTNADELITGINMLFRNNSALLGMMQENYRYYNNYLRPQNLVLNTLLKVCVEN